MSSTRNYTGPNALRMPEQTPECDILGVVPRPNDSQFHPIRAAFWYFMLVWLLVVGVQLYRMHRVGWVSTGGSGQTFEIHRLLKAGGIEFDASGATHIQEYYEFMYFTTVYQHPILKGRGPRAISVHFAGITRQRDNIEQEDAPQREPLSLEDLPGPVLRDYEKNKPAWVQSLTTVGPNDIVLGTSLDIPNGRYGFSPTTMRSKIWTGASLFPILRHVFVRASVIAAILAPPLYMFFYWCVYRSIIVLRRHVQGRCIKCGYPIDGLLCPECGTINRQQIGRAHV